MRRRRDISDWGLRGVGIVKRIEYWPNWSDNLPTPEQPNAFNAPEQAKALNALDEAPVALPFSPVVKRYYVKGTVDGTQVEALPDNGASLCFISQSLVSQLDLRPKPSTQRNVCLANRKVVHSPGMVEVPWQFAGEKTKHILQCWILQNSAHDLILGSSFLRVTQTLTKYVQRIKSEMVSLPKKTTITASRQ